MEYWNDGKRNNGIMEYWNIGLDSGLEKYFDL
jgi:hypothetical protein